MLVQRLARIASEYPLQTALVYNQTRLTYPQLYEQVSQLSRGLKSLGLGPSDCVAIILPNCPEFVVSFYAIAHIQAILLPLNPLFNAAEIQYYLQDSQVKAIITHSQWAASCEAILQKLDQDITLIGIDQAPANGIAWNDLLQTAAEPNELQAVETSATGLAHEPISLLPDSFDSAPKIDLLYQYSSGSTGRPKRVSRTQANLWHEVENFTATTKVTPSDRILCLVPLFHAHGLGNCLLAATYTGATLVLLEPVLRKGKPVEVPFVFRRARVLELIEQEGITILPGVPYIFGTLAETPPETPANLSTLRLCFSAGNFLSRETFDRFQQRFGILVRQLYGCTEAGSVAINLEAGEAIAPNSVGLPLQNIEVKIVSEQGQDLPPDAIGEVVIYSPSLTCGYHNQPELNRDAFRNGAFLTGDLGKKDSQGRLYITGRKKIFIDTGGRKVDPLEIEDILIDHPKIKEAVVVGTKGSHEGELIKAVVVSHDHCEEQEILSYCRGRLADFKVPRIIDFRDEIPKSPLGKVLRKNLV